MGNKRGPEPTSRSFKRRRRIIESSSSEEEIVHDPSPILPAPPPSRKRTRDKTPDVPSSRVRQKTNSVSSSRVRQQTPRVACTRNTASSRVRQDSVDSKSPHRSPSRGRPRAISPVVVVNRHASLSPPSSPRNVPLAQKAVSVSIDKDLAPACPEEPVPSAEPELDEDILQLLGDAPVTDTPFGPAVHKDIAARWQDILAKGLSKEIKEKLLSEYCVPSNCDLLQAPALNAEAKVALTEVMARRDTSLMHKQKQLGVALAALSTAMEMLIKNETSKAKLFKPVSDACRILCDLHSVDTKTRRSLVLSSINTTLKDTLLESSRDGKLLFGENVSEKLKAAKNIQRSGESLKQPQKFTKANFAYKNRGRPNFNPVHRKTDFKQSGTAAITGGVGGRAAARAPPPRQTRGNAAGAGAYYKQTYRDRDRSPPRRAYRR